MSQDPTAPRASHAPEADTRSTPADEQTDSPPLPGDAFADIRPRLKELAEYLNYYVSAKTDAAKASARRIGVYAAIGVVGLLALSTFIVTTMVLLCVGVAQMFTALFGGHAWAGNLVTAVLFLALTAGAIMFGMRKLTRQSRERTMAKYAQRKQQQRTQFGTDVQERAERPGA